MQPNDNSKNRNRPPRPNGGSNQNNRGQSKKRAASKPQPNQPQIVTNLTTSRGQAVRAQRRAQTDAQRIANQ